MPFPASSVIDQISASMSVRTLQHRVIASNIAHRDTQGYQRLRLQFDRAMAQAAGAGVVVDRSQASVSLEQDLVALSANSGKYQAMARALSRYFAIAATIVNPRG